MKRVRIRRGVVIGGAVLAVLFLARPSASHLQGRVVRSISTALGRAVEVGSVHWRFLPRPAFELENVVIHDDPAFGAEPLLRSPDVTASLQLGALIRGRIQISALILSDASLNLARNAAGTWNFGDLLQRTSSITVAPTGLAQHASRQSFPYIEATDARVNFKSGEEKLRFALMDAKFAVWQDSENAWGMRLQARPIRTDANLTDTGVINLSGTWQRAAVLHQTPFQLSWEWKHGQIGQLSELVSGNDSGWRGAIDFSGEAAGTAENMKINSDGSVNDFRREDVLVSGNLRLAAHCSADYSFISASISNLDCAAPSGSGSVELTGKLASAGGSPARNYDLRLRATNVPADSILSLARHAQKNFAADLQVDGQTNLDLRFSRNEENFRGAGGGELSALRISSSSNGGQFAVRTVPVSLICDGCTDQPARAKSQRRLTRGLNISPLTNSTPELAFNVGPLPIQMGRPNPLVVQASLSRSGYRASIRGDAEIKRLIETAHTAGIPVQPFNADGSATVDLNLAGSWKDRPKALGSAQLRSVFAQVKGINSSVGITRADLVLGEDTITVANLTASAAEATWHGSLSIPRPCVTPRDCKIEFNLRSAELNATALNKLLNPALQKKSWYRFLSLGDNNARYLMQARATGKLQIEKLLLGNTACSHFKTNLQLENGHVALSGASGSIFDGTISGEWRADFNPKPPQYKGSGNLSDVSLADVAELTHDGWMEGRGDANFQFSSEGSSVRELLNAADLKAQFSISEGLFPHVILTNATAPLHARAFSGELLLRDGEFSFRDTKLDSGRGVYAVSGTASLAGVLKLKLTGEAAPEFLLSGSILEPKVSTTPATAASLKP